MIFRTRNSRQRASHFGGGLLSDSWALVTGVACQPEASVREIATRAISESGRAVPRYPFGNVLGHVPGCETPMMQSGKFSIHRTYKRITGESNERDKDPNPPSRKKTPTPPIHTLLNSQEGRRGRDVLRGSPSSSIKDETNSQNTQSSTDTAPCSAPNALSWDDIQHSKNGGGPLERNFRQIDTERGCFEAVLLLYARRRALKTCYLTMREISEIHDFAKLCFEAM